MSTGGAALRARKCRAPPSAAEGGARREVAKCTLTLALLINPNPNPNPNRHQTKPEHNLDTNQVAKCAPDHPGEWCGEWEECTVRRLACNSRCARLHPFVTRG